MPRRSWSFSPIPPTRLPRALRYHAVVEGKQNRERRSESTRTRFFYPLSRVAYTTRGEADSLGGGVPSRFVREAHRYTLQGTPSTGSTPPHPLSVHGTSTESSKPETSLPAKLPPWQPAASTPSRRDVPTWALRRLSREAGHHAQKPRSVHDTQPTSSSPFSLRALPRLL